MFETANNKMWHSVVLSHIHLLIIFVNVLTQQPTEQFCLYCSNTYGGHCMPFELGLFFLYPLADTFFNFALFLLEKTNIVRSRCFFKV